METQGRIEPWIENGSDTGFVKIGVHSVGVARQYADGSARLTIAQVAVTLSIANHQASLPIAYRLYLPEEWANDAARRSKGSRPPTTAEVPDQAGDRAETDQGRAHGRCGARRRSDRRRLRAPMAGFRAGVTEMGADLCGGRAVGDQRLAPGMEPLPAQALERTRTQALARAARRRSSAGLGQGAGDDAAERSLARRVLA